MKKLRLIRCGEAEEEEKLLQALKKAEKRRAWTLLGVIAVLAVGWTIVFALIAKLLGA